MLKIGVIGAGHLGRIHLKCLLDLDEHYQLVGLYDIDPEVALAASQQFGVQAFASYEALLQAVDVVDIVTPTTTHFELAMAASPCSSKSPCRNPWRKRSRPWQRQKRLV